VHELDRAVDSGEFRGRGDSVLPEDVEIVRRDLVYADLGLSDDAGSDEDDEDLWEGAGDPAVRLPALDRIRF
jgi:hypothetical protein